MSPAEMTRSLMRIERMVEDLTKEFREEMRETRHKANNALQGVQLQVVRNEVFANDIGDLKKTVHDNVFPKLDQLAENAASQEAVDQYRKWLIGTVISLGGLGILNLVINLTQGGLK